MRCRPPCVATAGNRYGKHQLIDADVDTGLRDAWLIARFTGLAAGTLEDARRLLTGEVACS
jgi:hypothetical protein